MAAYYNEIEPYAAQWLRNLIAAGHIAAGDVDERSIVEVQPDDLRGYDQCHFFAGIAGWSYALRLAGWPDDRPVWTGSCPCQPFSSAGRQRGSDDERHLWPAFFRLIRECRPATVFGEQVAGAAGYAWWDHVAADLEGEGYAAAACDIGAHSVGAPHIRQRLYWVADADGLHASAEREQRGGEQRLHAKGGGVNDMANADAQRQGMVGRSDRTLEHGRTDIAWLGPWSGGKDGGMGNADNARLEGRSDESGECAGERASGPASSDVLVNPAVEQSEVPLQQRWNGVASPAIWSPDGNRIGGTPNPWRDLLWLPCADGKARPTQPGLQPLAHGIPNRVGRLRAYGNAIVPQVAAAFIEAAWHR